MLCGSVRPVEKVETLDWFDEVKKENVKLKQDMNVLERKLLEMKTDILKEVKQSFTIDLMEKKKKVVVEMAEKEDRGKRATNIVICGVG